jgi:hypothetical protein
MIIKQEPCLTTFFAKLTQLLYTPVIVINLLQFLYFIVITLLLKPKHELVNFYWR